MGSKSDYSVMKDCEKFLKLLKVKYQTLIISAHRTPKRMFQFAETAEKNGWTKFISMQNHLNLIYREEEREMIPLCISDDLAITPWSPLARGFLAGNRSKNGGGETDRAKNDVLADNYYYSKADFKILDSVKKIAKKENRKPVEVALAWLLQKKGITAPIIGPGKLEQLKTLLNSMTLKLSKQQISSLEKHYQPKNISGHF